MKRHAAQKRGSKQPAKKPNAKPIELVTVTVQFSSEEMDAQVNMVRQGASTVQKLELKRVTLDALQHIAVMDMPHLVSLHIWLAAPPKATEGSAEQPPVAPVSSSWWADRGAEGSTLTALHWHCLGASIYGKEPSLSTAAPILSLLAAHRYTLRRVELADIDKKFDSELREALGNCAVLDTAELPCGYVSHVPVNIPANVPDSVKSQIPPVGPALPASLRRLVLHMQCGSMVCLERLPAGVTELSVQSFAIDGSPILPVLSELKGLQRLELQIGWGSKKESVQVRRRLAAALPRAKVTVPWMLDFLFSSPPPFL